MNEPKLLHERNQRMEYVREFKTNHPEVVRRSESQRITTKYTDRIPIIIDRFSKATPKSDRNKFLAPADLSVGQISIVIRRRINIDKEQALFLFVNRKIPKPDTTLRELYRSDVDSDGFLYIMYSVENVFG